MAYTQNGLRVLKGVGLLAACMLILFLLLFGYQSLRPVKLEGLSLVTLSGQQVNPDSLLHGKKTILNFWATWCKPCIAEMPMLDSVHQRLDPGRWQLVLVSDEPVEKIEAFRAKKNFSLTFLRSDQPLGTMGIGALPKTIVIDAKKNVLYSNTGELTMGSEAMLEMLEILE